MTTLRRWGALAIASTLVGLVALPTAGAQSTSAARDRIEKLGSEISVLAEDYNLATIELKETEARVRSARIAQADSEKKLKELRAQASERANAIYRAGTPKLLVALLGAKSFKEFQATMDTLSTVSAWEVELVEKLEITKERSTKLAAELQQDLDAKQKIVDRISNRRTSLESKVSAQKKLLVATPPKKPVQPKIDLTALRASPLAKVAVAAAYQQLGKPYRYGAAGPNAFDCSGLTMYAWGKAGVSLPHSTTAQYRALKKVAKSQLQPGDIVFYLGKWRHSGVYIGNGKMVHAVHPGVNARIDSINYISGYAGAGRPGI